MRRREFIATLAGASAWPVVAYGQERERMRRIGLFLPYSEQDPQGPPRIAALREGLRQYGRIEGRNVHIEYRWGAGQVERMQAMAKELVALSPDVILVQSDPAVAALLRETRTIPIIFVTVGDPIGGGFIESLARPGGNATGFTNFDPTIGGKWLELLTEIAPSVARALVVLHSETAANANFLRAAEAAAPALKVTVTAANVHDAGEIEAAVNAFEPERGGGIVVMPHPVTASNRNVIFDLAARHRLPAVYPFRFFAQGGGLVAYGIDQVDHFRRAGAYIDRILKGDPPSDLPTQASTRFELVVNLKTAKALGLTVPSSLLARADEVIE